MNMITIVMILIFIWLVLLAGIRYGRIKLSQTLIILIFLSFLAEIIIEYTEGGTSSLSVAFCLGLILFAALGLPTIFLGKILEKNYPNERTKN